MTNQLTFADIIKKALDKDYSVEQAAMDLGELMTEREKIMRRYGTDYPRFRNWKQLSRHKKLALGNCVVRRSLNNWLS